VTKYHIRTAETVYIYAYIFNGLPTFGFMFIVGRGRVCVQQRDSCLRRVNTAPSTVSEIGHRCADASRVSGARARALRSRTVLSLLCGMRSVYRPRGISLYNNAHRVNRGGPRRRVPNSRGVIIGRPNGPPSLRTSLRDSNTTTVTGLVTLLIHAVPSSRSRL